MTEVSAWSPKGWGFKVLGIVGGLAGAVVGQYSGVNLLIPLFATGLVWWGGTKVLKDEKKEILSAFAVNAGHFLTKPGRRLLYLVRRHSQTLALTLSLLSD